MGITFLQFLWSLKDNLQLALWIFTLQPRIYQGFASSIKFSRGTKTPQFRLGQSNSDVIARTITTARPIQLVGKLEFWARASQHEGSIHPAVFELLRVTIPPAFC